MVNPTEAHAILFYLENSTNLSIKNSVVARLKNIKNTSNKSAPGPNTPCVFLNQNDECDIRPVRPFPCRAYVSSDQNQCILWESNGHIGVKPGFSNWSKPALALSATYSKQYCGENYEVGEINSVMKMYYLGWSQQQLNSLLK